MRIEQQIEYEAQSEAEAMQIARERLGREAYVISSRPYKTGGIFGFWQRDALWVTAGILVPDEEDIKRENLDRLKNFQSFLDFQRATHEHNSRQEFGNAPDTEPPTAFKQNTSTIPTKVVVESYGSNSRAQSQPGSDVLTQKVDKLEEKLSQVLTRLDAEPDGQTLVTDTVPRESAPEDEIAAKLIAADVDREIAVSLSKEFHDRAAGGSFNDWLARSIPVMGSDTSSALGGRKVLFAGSTGVGKTTTIAKIASDQSLWDGRRVVLMTADTYRIAAVEQLRTYAKILSVPIEIVPEPKDIQAALKRHSDADLVLLDTAGRSHYDESRIQELNALYDAFEPDSVHLVAAANVRYRDMQDIIERMGVVPLSSVLFTKLDETSSYGIMLNVMKDFGRPLSFFTTGQNVPNDIEVARGDRFVDLLMGIEKIKREQ